jgi:hypothetical protein
MDKLPKLSSFASECLQYIMTKYPQFLDYIVPSDIYENGWSSEIPWPNGWESVGLMVSTRINYKWETLRIDFGNMDAELFPNTYKTIKELLHTARKIIDDIFSEKTVLIAKWGKYQGYIGKWANPNYLPENDTELWGSNEIWMRSWNGTYDKVWKIISKEK